MKLDPITKDYYLSPDIEVMEIIGYIICASGNIERYGTEDYGWQ